MITKPICPPLFVMNYMVKHWLKKIKEWKDKSSYNHINEEILF